MKKQLIILILALISTPLILADSTDNAMTTKGVYLSLGLGVGQTGYADDINSYIDDINKLWSVLFTAGLHSGHDFNFGGKATIGYVWNRNFDTEVSYYNFSGAHYHKYFSLYNVSEDYTVEQQAVALAAVGRLPLGNDNADIYLKAGAAYTWVNFHLEYNNPAGVAPVWSPNQSNYNKTFRTQKVAPLVGLGIEQSLGKHFTTALEWVEIFSSGKAIGDPLNSKMSNAALYSASITYKF